MLRKREQRPTSAEIRENARVAVKVHNSAEIDLNNLKNKIEQLVKKSSLEVRGIAWNTDKKYATFVILLSKPLEELSHDDSKPYHIVSAISGLPEVERASIDL